MKDNIAVTGEQYYLQNGGYRATITGLGGGLRDLSFEDIDLIMSFPADELPPKSAGQLLMPWPNRIADGQYQFKGNTEQLPINEPLRGNAIHGLTRWLTFHPTKQTSTHLTLNCTLLGQPGYPHVLDLVLDYELDAEFGLTITLTATNCGTTPAPFGYGAHPYLVTGAAIDECELEIPARKQIMVDDRGIPIGIEDIDDSIDFHLPRLIRQSTLDTAFFYLYLDHDRRANTLLIGPKGTVALWQDTSLPYIQVFTDPDRLGVAIEPMTCPPNAFITGENLMTLFPGRMSTHSFGIYRIERTL